MERALSARANERGPNEWLGVASRSDQTRALAVADRADPHGGPPASEDSNVFCRLRARRRWTDVLLDGQRSAVAERLAPESARDRSLSKRSVGCGVIGACDAQRSIGARR